MSGYQLAEDVSLAGRNTFRVPARAAMMADVSRADALAELFEFASLRDGPVLVLGEGSNLLFADDFPGVAICLTMAGVRIVQDDGDTALVRAEAGMNWNDLVSWTLARGLVGLENMALIPGTVGASPIQNIGAYGVEVGEYASTPITLPLANSTCGWNHGTISPLSSASDSACRLKSATPSSCSSPACSSRRPSTLSSLSRVSGFSTLPSTRSP